MNHFPLYWAIYSIVTNNQLGDPSGSMTSEKAVFCQKKAGICERIQNVFFYHQLAACLASSLGSSLHHNDWKSTKLVHLCNSLLCAATCNLYKASLQRNALLAKRASPKVLSFAALVSRRLPDQSHCWAICKQVELCGKVQSLHLTSQQLQMLSRLLSDCQSLTLNVKSYIHFINL